MTEPHGPSMVCQARAKINLALHVTGRRADGYHLLDSLVVFADIGDRLELAGVTGTNETNETSLEISGPFGGALKVDDDNLVLRAHQALSAALPNLLPATSFKLTKNLPVSSGIGGGSADAAAALNGLVELWQLDIEPHTLSEIALLLGADVPVCLGSTTCRLRGVGEQLTAIENFPAVDCLLVNPGVGVSTPAVFNQMALPIDQQAFSELPELPASGWIDWVASTRNDLQSPAISLAPEIAHVIAVLEHSPGCNLARMSGSGATCFGLFDGRQETSRAAQQIAKTHPDWWVVATQLG